MLNLKRLSNIKKSRNITLLDLSISIRLELPGHVLTLPRSCRNSFTSNSYGPATSKTIIQVQASWVFVGPVETIEKKSKILCTVCSFVRSLVRSKIFQILVRADAIDLVQKSSNFEPSSRFFGRLKILNSKRRRNEAFEFDSSCRAPQRALQLESNSNATV